MVKMIKTTRSLLYAVNTVLRAFCWLRMVKAELIWQMVPGDNAVGCVCMALVQHEQAFMRLQSVLGWCSWWRKKVWHPTSSTSSRPFLCTDVLFTPHWKWSVHLPCGLDVIFLVECLINAAPPVISFFDSLCNILFYMVTISGHGVCYRIRIG